MRSFAKRFVFVIFAGILGYFGAITLKGISRANTAVAQPYFCESDVCVDRSALWGVITWEACMHTDAATGCNYLAEGGCKSYTCS